MSECKTQNSKNCIRLSLRPNRGCLFYLAVSLFAALYEAWVVSFHKSDDTILPSMKDQTVVKVEDWDIKVNPCGDEALLFQAEIEEFHILEDKSCRNVSFRVLKDMMKLKFIILEVLFMLVLIIWVSLKE